VLEAAEYDLPLQLVLRLGHVLALDLLSNVSEVADVDTVLVEEIAQRLRVRWHILSLRKALDQRRGGCFLEESGQPLDLLLLSLDLILGHR
jgi:hypothetical protein